MSYNKTITFLTFFALAIFTFEIKQAEASTFACSEDGTFIQTSFTPEFYQFEYFSPIAAGNKRWNIIEYKLDEERQLDGVEIDISAPELKNFPEKVFAVTYDKNGRFIQIVKMDINAFPPCTVDANGITSCTGGGSGFPPEGFGGFKSAEGDLAVNLNSEKEVSRVTIYSQGTDNSGLILKIKDFRVFNNIQKDTVRECTF